MRGRTKFSAEIVTGIVMLVQNGSPYARSTRATGEDETTEIMPAIMKTELSRKSILTF